MAGIVGVEQIPVDSHFFDDLGADSLLMAQFCARVRKLDGLPPVSIKDIYRNPTISGLAAALAESEPEPVEKPQPAANPAPPRASTLEYFGCGALQLLFFLAYSALVGAALSAGTDWITGAAGLLGGYLRAVVFSGTLLVALCTLPIGLKWLFVGRWQTRRIRIWSLAYVRFWIVKTVVQRNLLVLFFAGSPLYSLYLRALGAKIGRGVTVFSPFAPVCTDLLSLGDGAVVGRDCHFAGYRARGDLIETGPVTIGPDAFVGELTVLDIGTTLGAGAQLGHSSSLHAGQSVPPGQSWHGSPAQRAGVDYRQATPMACGRARRTLFAIRQLLTIVLVLGPLVLGGIDLLLSQAPRLGEALGLGAASLDFSDGAFYFDALVISFVLFFGFRLAGFLIMVTVPRLLNLAIEPGRVYRLYGFHYSAHRAIRAVTNAKFFKTLFGDSVAIVHYLRGIGCELTNAEQTGSNFGLQEKYENPYLSSVGRGTMIADGLSIVNAAYSSTSFRVSKASIGARNFIGNYVAYPAGARTGDNCLLATKVLVPMDGPVREGVGLLGSPSFEIPRTVERDQLFDHPRTPEEFRRRLAAKTRHNAGGMVFFLLTQWLFFFGLLLMTWATEVYYGLAGGPLLALDSVVTILYSIGYFVLVERAVTLIRPLRPVSCSIYDRRFWRHERFWKLAATVLHLQLLNGTPFKGVAWRLLGARVGRRLFDDGGGMPEKTLVTIGDHVTLNVASVLQCHSQEDGGFKMDRIRIGDGCTVGVGALVHYGVTMGDGAVLDADSFLMKGEEVPENACWGGNPAREIRPGHYPLG